MVISSMGVSGGGIGALEKLPKTQEVKDSKDSMGVTLAKMLNIGERELEEPTSGRLNKASSRGPELLTHSQNF